MTALESAAALATRGWSVIPVPFRQKGPLLHGWQKLRLRPENLRNHFNGQPQNIGVLLGDASRGLVDVDLDCREAMALASSFLPPTASQFGRRSRPLSHWLYLTSPIA